MAKRARIAARREDSLSRDRIVGASIELLDESGEGGLTFRALSERLATGPGAIYGHIAGKGELLTAACDAIVTRTLAQRVVGATPEETIRDLAGGMFDAIDAHPWVGSALASPEGQRPMVRVLERLGQGVQALDVPEDALWTAVGALLNYILGVGGRNAANGQLARARGLDRSDFLEAVATMWSRLDPNEYPFTRGIAERVRAHDDRADFIAGIDLILRGIDPKLPRAPDRWTIAVAARRARRRRSGSRDLSTAIRDGAGDPTRRERPLVVRGAPRRTRPEPRPSRCVRGRMRRPVREPGEPRPRGSTKMSVCANRTTSRTTGRSSSIAAS